jgi:hypothetical protein
LFDGERDVPNVAEFIQNITDRASRGLDFADNIVVRALDFEEVRDQLQGLVDQGYGLIGGEPLPSAIDGITQVLFRLSSPKHSDQSGVIILFERSSNRLISVSDPATLPAAAATGFGAIPFALNAPSFVRSTVGVASAPANMQMQARRTRFAAAMNLPGGTREAATGTPVGCYEGFTYGTNASYDTNGTTDWHTVDDYGQKWVYDDIAVDDQSSAMGAPATRDAATGTPAGCWEGFTYGTNESYDTNGTKDWHTIDDHGEKWVYDDIKVDD